MTPSILIIGADRGLGLGLAQQFFDRGWDVAATVRHGDSDHALRAVGTADPARLTVAHVDVTKAGEIEPLLAELGDGRFDVVFSNAGVFGAEHQSVVDATDAEFAEVMLVNCFGPMRLAHHLLDRLRPGGSYCFMASHRGSIEINLEGGLELYRASKVSVNMLAHGLWASNRERGLTVLLIHPGWVRTEMGTLGGKVEAEIDLEPSVSGVATVVERHRGSGQIFYRDWEDRPLGW